MYVRAGRPAFARPCEGVHKSTSLMSSSLLLQQCPACLVRLKRSFFQAAVASILLYGCTTWTLTKRLEKKLDGNYTRILRVILNKSWRQHPTRHQLYGHLLPITKTIQVRRTRNIYIYIYIYIERERLYSIVSVFQPRIKPVKSSNETKSIMIFFPEIDL